MSFTLVTGSVAPSAASTSPSATSTPSSNGGNLLFNTSTLLFGFLVTALSLFGVFMTLAIIWNRLVARRRAIDAMLALSSPTSTTRTLRRPLMWDVWVSSDKKPLQWPDEKPLAADRLRNLPQSPQSEQTLPFWKRRLLTLLPPEITYLLRNPILAIHPPNDTGIFPAELTNGSDIQVSLLISMPHAPSTREREDEDSHSLHELVLGTTSVVYHDPALS